MVVGSAWEASSPQPFDPQRPRIRMHDIVSSTNSHLVYKDTVRLGLPETEPGSTASGRRSGRHVPSTCSSMYAAWV